MDLNIDNYSITDLENFFRVKKGRYTDADVEKREYENNFSHQGIYIRNSKRI